jgi:NADH-quinone oxidoreductase subunit E
MTQLTLNKDEMLPRIDEGIDPTVIQRILKEHGEDRGGLIAILEDVQAEYGYLSETALRTVAAETGRSLVDVYGVATFFRSFSLQPRGRHLIIVCLGTACHVRSAPMIVGEFERQLGIRPGETTPDREFTLETVNCLGACALGPIVVVDGHYFSNVDTAKVGHILNETLTGLPQAEEMLAATSDE